ncbi:MAG TPA: CHAT domain-containing protein [Acidobacteriota bacterium]|nr:CHAT domain-containing protein [Acidobacteriota bacterium]HRV08684.1 CHAT domain-containing protein [Acidobacteriota bacterium]
MIRKSLAVAVQAVLSISHVAAQTVSSLPPEECVQLYRASPLELHRRLRRDASQGLPVAPCVAAVAAKTGDRSFDDFGELDGLLTSGLALHWEAVSAWEARDRGKALQLFRLAEKHYGGIHRSSEAGFCRYFQAELLSEKGDLKSALAAAEPALAAARGRGRHYQAALLEESRAFALWFLGELDRASVGFARALELWETIGFNDGQVAGWNNLASIYEELGLGHRAEVCYIEALSRLRRQTAPEIRGRLLLNFALFSKHQGDSERALRFLGLARPYQSFTGTEFQMAEAEILELPTIIVSVTDGSPESNFRRILLQALTISRLGENHTAIELLKEALEQARQQRISYYERRLGIQLGRLLESQGRFVEANWIYQDLFASNPLLRSFSPVFPFEEALSSLLGGQLRTLVAEGRTREAQLLLSHWRRLRYEKARQMLAELGRHPVRRVGGDENWGTMIQWGTGRLDSFPTPAPWDAGALKNAVLLEFWPDEETGTFVWLRTPDGVLFRRLAPAGRYRQDVESLAASLRQNRHALTAELNIPLLRRLAEILLHPLLPELNQPKLVFLPHGLLELVPFEALPLPDGRPLANQYITAYGHPGEIRWDPSERVREPPVAVLSKELRDRSGYQMERAYFRGIPGVRLMDQATFDRLPYRANWLYLASHLRLDSKLWFLSTFRGDGRAGALAQLSRRPLECDLLLLATCEGAQSGWEATPFWMGLGELLLASGAKAVVANRWPLDERSVPIYLQTLTYARQGVPVDEALARARREFLRSHARHPQLRHPFYWAGVVYLGFPGLELESEIHLLNWARLVPALLLLLGLATANVHRAVRFHRSLTTSRIPK